MTPTSMTHGTAFTPDGVRFSLWAPSAKTVALVLGGQETKMPDLGEGWRSVVIAGAGPGDTYEFRIDGDLLVPDPASRCQQEDVHGPSVVVNPGGYAWQAAGWKGRPWEETVLYELHVGTATPEGTFTALIERLDHIRDLGVTAIELMPIADFPGSRNWGYDGVLPYAPDRAYGSPDDLKRLVDEAHARDLQVFLDVVYNHFGPDGNYLHAYAKSFFNQRKKTPWGDALDFDRQPVRDFFIQNAIYWLDEYRFDGLRFDAVHAIEKMGDPADEPFLEAMAKAVRAAIGHDRSVHLVLENDDNNADLLAGNPQTDDRYTAQWNDDLHHILHRMVTGEVDGYYADYEQAPANRLARALSQGFDYQGEPSGHRGGAARGRPSAHLPPTAFCAFLQNHDQVGNRAMGERISEAASPQAVEAATVLYLLSPQVPLIWMGEEWAASSRFPFFCDFEGNLTDAVREGRRREFAQFKRFSDPDARRAIPDPNEPATFDAAKLDWSELDEAPHAERLSLFRELLSLRRRHVVPLLKQGMPTVTADVSGGAIRVDYAWQAGRLTAIANLSDEEAERPAGECEGTLLYATAPLETRTLPPWFCAWYLGAP